MCRDRCLLEDPASASLSLDAFFDQLDGCTECPLVTGPDALAPLVHLIKRKREAARRIRALESKARQHKIEMEEVQKELDGYESRLEKLEALHRSSAMELEAQIERARSADAARARLATILQTTRDFVAIYDASRRPIFLNQAAREMIGLDPDESIANLTMADVHGAATEHLLLEALPRAIESGSWVGDSVLARPDGRLLPISQSIIAHRGASGDVDYFSTIGRDISPYKEVDRLKSEFISTVSHELRTPLTAIRGSLGLLEGGVAGELPEVALEMVSIARQNTDRLIRLINDILDLEKMEAGKLVLRVDRCEVTPLLEAAALELGAAAREVGVSIAITSAPAISVRADRDRVIQVLINLIGNAIKFSPPGSVIEIGATPRLGEGIRFYVEDRGAGIAREDQDRLFRKFSQVDGSDKRSLGGSGLGLAICRAIVEEHGGAIGVSSERGRGSTFWFELPGDASIPESRTRALKEA